MHRRQKMGKNRRQEMGRQKIGKVHKGEEDRKWGKYTNLLTMFMCAVFIFISHFGVHF